MTNGALIEELKKRNPMGNAQIFIRGFDPDGNSAYFEITNVNGFIDGPDTVIEAGEVICTGP